MSWAHTLYSVVHQLADVIRPSFSPLGRDQLLHGPATITITNSTHTILAVLVASPHYLPCDTTSTAHRAVASVIINQLRQCVDLHGDGSGAVLLGLEAALWEVLSWLRERGIRDADDGSGGSRAHHGKATRTLIQSLDAVDREWLQTRDESGEVTDSGLMTELRAIGQPVDSALPSQLAAIRQLLHTQLGQSSATSIPLMRPSPH